MGTIVALVMAAITAMATELATATFLAVGLLLAVTTLTVVATTMVAAMVRDRQAAAATRAAGRDEADAVPCHA